MMWVCLSETIIAILIMWPTSWILKNTMQVIQKRNMLLSVEKSNLLIIGLSSKVLTRCTILIQS